MTLPTLPPILYRELVTAALREDLGRGGDVTTDAVVPTDMRAEARIRTRIEGRIAGLEVALEAFRVFDGAIECEALSTDGIDVGTGDILAVIRGRARSILGAERVALNFLGHMSGIATTTRDLVARTEGSNVMVVDTRKTTPGLRALEKYAVRMGGGGNHRLGLDDAILIKDNHIAVAGSVTRAVERARRHAGHTLKIEVEVDSLDQLDEALEAGVDLILLDNMNAQELRQAVERNQGGALLEASGGITGSLIGEVAATGVDLISVGWLTHSSAALDVGLDVQPLGPRML